MQLSRLFVSQEALDEWLTEGLVDIEQDRLTFKSIGVQCSLRTALYFIDEVAGGGDQAQLVGKVKDLTQLEAVGGEHCADSVILDDNAYQVVEGFVAEVLPDARVASGATAPDSHRPDFAAVISRLVAI